MLTKIRRFFASDEGATAIEYGLIAALISVAIIVAVGAIGDELVTTFNAIDNALENANA